MNMEESWLLKIGTPAYLKMNFTKKLGSWKRKTNGCWAFKKKNKRFLEALELIAKSKFYFDHGEEEKQLRRVCKIVEEALKEGEENH